MRPFNASKWYPRKCGMNTDLSHSPDSTMRRWICAKVESAAMIDYTLPDREQLDLVVPV